MGRAEHLSKALTWGGGRYLGEGSVVSEPAMTLYIGITDSTGEGANSDSVVLMRVQG